MSESLFTTDDVGNHVTALRLRNISPEQAPMLQSGLEGRASREVFFPLVMDFSQVTEVAEGFSQALTRFLGEVRETSSPEPVYFGLQEALASQIRCIPQLRCAASEQEACATVMVRDYRRIQIHQLTGGVVCTTFTDRKILDMANITEAGADLFVLAHQPGTTPLLILDFQSVEFLSSAFLNKLIILDKMIKAREGRLKLCGLKPEIQEVFVITRLNQLYDIRDSVDDALWAIQHSGGRRY